MTTTLPLALPPEKRKASRVRMGSKPFGDDPIVVAYGAGVDSTAMLIGLQRLEIKPTMILFADTAARSHRRRRFSRS